MKIKSRYIWRVRAAKDHSYAWIYLSWFPPIMIFQILKFERFIKHKRHNIRKHPLRKDVYILRCKKGS